MTLTIGTGPFGEQSTGTYNFEVKAPRGHALYLEDSPRRAGDAGRRDRGR